MKIVVKPLVCAALSAATIAVPTLSRAMPHAVTMATRERGVGRHLAGRDASGDAVRQGLKYQSKKEYDKAIESFTKAIHLQPRNINAYLARGDVYREMQNYDRAIADYEYLIDQYGVADAYYGRGVAYVNQNKVDKALADFAQAIEICDLPAGSLPELNGGRKLTPGDFAAYQEWQRAVDERDSEEDHKKNTAALAYAARGEIYLEQKQFDKAIAEFSRATFKNPKFAEAHAGMGAAHYALKDYASAVFQYNFAVLMQPKVAAHYHNRGIVYLDAGSNDKAIADFEKCLQLDPKAPDAANTQALIAAAKTPKIASAPIAPTVAVAARTETAQDAYGRGDGFRDQKEYEKAVAAYSDAIRLKPDYAIAFKARADAYRTMRQFDKAVTDYDEALRLYPDIAGAADKREAAIDGAKQQSEKIAQNTEAIRLNPKDPDAYTKRGLIYFEQGEYDKALADFTTSIGLRPDDFETVGYRATAYIALKQYPKALADLESLKKLSKDKDERKNLQDLIDETKKEAAKNP